MATRTLRVTLADVLGPAGPSGRVSGEVWAVFVDGDGSPRQIRYTDGTVVVPAAPRQSLNSAGVVDFAIVPNDDATIHADDQGFGVKVGWDLTVRGVHGAKVAVKNPGTVVSVVTADPAPPLFVQFGLKAPYVPVIPGATYLTDGAAAATYETKANVASGLAGKVGQGSQIIVPTEAPYNAAGNGVTDDTTAIQAAVTACPAGGVVDGLGKTYLVTVINLKSDMTFRNFKLLTKAASSGFVSPVTVGAYADTTLRKNITIRNVKVDGQRAGQTNLATAEDGGRHGFRIIGRVEDLLLEDCAATNCASDGLALFHGSGMAAFLSTTTGIQKRITVTRCTFSNNRRHGMSADSVDGVTFTDVTANGNGLDVGAAEGELGATLGGFLYGNGIDVEEYAITTWSGNLTFTRCTMLGNAKSAVLCYQPGANLASDGAWVPRSGYYFKDCTFDNGVSAAANEFAIEVTPLSANKALGWYFDDVVVEGCTLRGAVSLRSVKNARHDGGTVTVPGAVIGNADYVQSLTVSAPRGGKRYGVSNAAVKYANRDEAETILLSPADLSNVGGTPTLAASTFIAGWGFSDAETDRVGAIFRIPADWATAHFDLVWTNGVATAGAVTWRLDTGAMTIGAALTDAASGTPVAITAGAQNIITESRLATSRTVTPGYMNLELIRLGTDGADTLAGNAQVLAVKITRAS